LSTLSQEEKDKISTKEVEGFQRIKGRTKRWGSVVRMASEQKGSDLRRTNNL